MTDKCLIEEIIKRLGDNFYESKKPYYHDGKLCAITDSETAADSLEETLFNLALDGSYERIIGLSADGIWESKFVVKEHDKTEKNMLKHEHDPLCCLNCRFYDMNDQNNAFGTCEPQDTDFHCTNECNLSKEELKELEGLTGHGRVINKD
ncbi:MAG: hypothetical protein ACRC36_00180 [Lacrimispora sphenoides]